MEGESSVTRSISEELNSNSWDVEVDQMEDEDGVTRSFIDELPSWDIQGDQMKGESMVLLEVSLVNEILRICKEIKWKVKVMLLEISFMNFILWISKEIKWKVKVVLLEVSLMKFILRLSKEMEWK